MNIRKARKDDAPDLAALINLAGEGMPFYLWQQMKAENQTLLEFGAIRAAREEGGFSYTHAWVVEADSAEDDEVAAMILGYKQPDPYDLDDLDECPEVVRSIVELESMAPGSWYINAIATYEQFRGQGLGSRLINLAADIAKNESCDSISLIVASENTDAKRLYERLGFNALASLPIVSFPGFPHSGDWVLMVKNLEP